jgi:hypothetical protein
MHLLSDNSSAVVWCDAFIHELPRVLSRIQLDYVEKRGMWSIFDGCIDGSIQPGVISVHNGDYDWFIERRQLPKDCNMHWNSPVNARTHDDLLEHMGSGGICYLMNAIGSVSLLHVTKLMIYQLKLRWCLTVKVFVFTVTMMKHFPVKHGRFFTVE